MSHPAERLAALVENRFAQWLSDCRVRLGEVTIEVPAGHLRELCLALRDQEEFAFQQLVDLCGIDYLDYGRVDWETSETASVSGFSRGVQARAPDAKSGEKESRPRFAVVYHLLSYEHNQRIRVRSAAQGEPPRVDSVADIWNSANWYEREAFDLFGILFEGHPDLRRLLCDYGFIGHPFRKDFPLIGEVEMRYDPERGRVIYEPVSIEPRTLVPRVIRDPAGDSGGGGEREPPADA